MILNDRRQHRVARGAFFAAFALLAVGCSGAGKPELDLNRTDCSGDAALCGSSFECVTYHGDEPDGGPPRVECLLPCMAEGSCPTECLGCNGRDISYSDLPLDYCVCGTGGP